MPESLLFTEQQVLDLERDTDSVVWVFAPDIALGPQMFAEVMRENITKKNVIYKYLLSDDRETVENLFDFIDDLDLGDAESRFEVRLLPGSFIESDVTIYDPGTQKEFAFIAAPSEVEHLFWRLVGEALYRAKQRFVELWRLADPIDDYEATKPGQAQRGFIHYTWQCLGGRRACPLDRWEQLGRKIAVDEPTMAGDTDRSLVGFLIEKYKTDNPVLPPFHEIAYPADIRETASKIHDEAIACYLAGAESSAIAMCGKLLELGLRYYFETNSDTKLDENIGLGNLIRKVSDAFPVQLDEGLKNIVNFVNMYRIMSVHYKGFKIPTNEQSMAVLMMTYDSMRKLF